MSQVVILTFKQESNHVTQPQPQEVMEEFPWTFDDFPKLLGDSTLQGLGHDNSTTTSAGRAWLGGFVWEGLFLWLRTGETESSIYIFAFCINPWDFMKLGVSKSWINFAMLYGSKLLIPPKTFFLGTRKKHIWGEWPNPHGITGITYNYTTFRGDLRIQNCQKGAISDDPRHPRSKVSLHVGMEYLMPRCLMVTLW